MMHMCTQEPILQAISPSKFCVGAPLSPLSLVQRMRVKQLRRRAECVCVRSVSPAPALHCRVAHAIVQKSARVSSVQVEHTDEGQQWSGGGDVRREQAT